MNVAMKNFGDMLMSRPAGREDFLKAKAYIFCDLTPDDIIVLDFKDVNALAPSWADEFLTGIKENFSNKIEYINTDSKAVSDTLNFLETF